MGMSDGLIAGAIGQGLSSFTDSYLRSKQIKEQQLAREDQRGLARRQQKLQEQQAGVSYDEASDSYKPTGDGLLGQGRDKAMSNIYHLSNTLSQMRARGQYSPQMEALLEAEMRRVEGNGSVERNTQSSAGLTTPAAARPSEVITAGIPAPSSPRGRGIIKDLVGGKDAMSEGQKAVDKKYAEAYNTFTQRGRVNSIAGLDRLKSIAQEMEGDIDPTGTGLFESGGGRIAGELPDALRSRDAIRRRDQSRNAANTTLKELFGGQLSDAEREAAAKEYYNDALDNKTNAGILRDKIKQLDSGLLAETEKAKYFEKHGTLRGFKGASEFPRTIRKGNKTATVSNQKELEEAKKEGWE